ncbi:hypothetical protein AHAS_Ahas09G0112600 [Arachis hypogaea]
MTVAEYTNRFEKLCQFSRVCQSALKGYEEWKCIKYKGGLRSDIISAVMPIEIRIFSELVNKSRVIEDCLRKATLANGDRQEFYKRDQDKSYASRDQNFKRGGYASQYNHRGQWCGKGKNM